MPTPRRTSIYAKPKRSRGPVVAVLIVVLLALCAVGVAVFAMGGNRGAATAPADATNFDNDAQTQASASAGVAEDIVMTLGGSKDTYVLTGEDYLEAGCHAVDLDGGDVTKSITIDGSVDTSKPGTYTVIYTASDASGAIAQTKRNVHVVDSFEANALSIPVLMYHYVYSADEPPANLNNNYLLDSKLEEQCAYLAANNYYYPSFQELRAFVEGTHTLPAKSVVLTFDDGEAGFLKYGVPVLNKHGVPATSFVVCSDADAAEKITLNASEAVQFQSHTYNMHRDGSNVGQGGVIHALSRQQIYDDIRQAQAILGTTEAVAYPYGDNNETAWAALSDANVLCAFTVKNDRIRPGDNPLALNRVRISGEYTMDGFKSLVSPDA